MGTLWNVKFNGYTTLNQWPRHSYTNGPTRNTTHTTWTVSVWYQYCNYFHTYVYTLSQWERPSISIVVLAPFTTAIVQAMYMYKTIILYDTSCTCIKLYFTITTLPYKANVQIRVRSRTHTQMCSCAHTHVQLCTHTCVQGFARVCAQLRGNP